MKEMAFGIATTCLVAAACSGEPVPVVPDPGAGGGTGVAGHAGSPIFAILPPPAARGGSPVIAILPPPAERGGALGKGGAPGTGGQGGYAGATPNRACSTDADCLRNEVCQGASNCPPGAICILPSRPGVCVPKATCPAGTGVRSDSSCGPVVLPNLGTQSDLRARAADARPDCGGRR